MENIKKLALVLIVSCMIWSCDNDTPSDELIDASHQEDSIDVPSDTLNAFFLSNSPTPNYDNKDLPFFSIDSFYSSLCDFLIADAPSAPTCT